MTDHKLSILEKDLNFFLVSKKIQKEDIIISIEQLLFKLEDHKKEIIRRVFQNFKRSSIPQTKLQ